MIWYYAIILYDVARNATLRALEGFPQALSEHVCFRSVHFTMSLQRVS